MVQYVRAVRDARQRTLIRGKSFVAWLWAAEWVVQWRRYTRAHQVKWPGCVDLLEPPLGWCTHATTHKTQFHFIRIYHYVMQWSSQVFWTIFLQLQARDLKLTSWRHRDRTLRGLSHPRQSRQRCKPPVDRLGLKAKIFDLGFEVQSLGQSALDFIFRSELATVGVVALYVTISYFITFHRPRNEIQWHDCSCRII